MKGFDGFLKTRNQVGDARCLPNPSAREISANLLSKVRNTVASLFGNGTLAPVYA